MPESPARAMSMAEQAEEKTLSVSIPPEQAGRRLDQALASLLPDFTRSQIQRWIEDGRVRVGGRLLRKRDKLTGGERVEVRVPSPEPSEWQPEPIGLDIVYEDGEILVIHKPPGLVVHPGAGQRAGTLVNALLNHAPSLAVLPRAGIVHRLDKDTSGLMVVAKTERARQSLIRQLQERTLTREYVAVVHGVMIAGGTVQAPIGRHRVDRKRMAVTERGKEAVSHYRVLKRYRAHTFVQVRLESGRTHQIRVHMAHLGFPVVGDPVYGGRLRLPADASERLKRVLRDFRRQALHAVKLELIHPATGQKMRWAASVPRDMADLLEALAEDARRHTAPEHARGGALDRPR